mgnify:CR=1 FL=1
MKKIDFYFDISSPYSYLAHEQIKLFEKENKSSDSLITERVTEETIAEIVSKWTHIPVTKLMTGDKERIINLKKDYS